MRERLPALSLFFLGISLAAFVVTSVGPGDAQAAKKRKQPKSRTAQPVQRAAARVATPLPPIQRTHLYAKCPPEMVNVAGRFCIDRWEATVVDADTQRPFSPYYPPHARLASQMQKYWEQEFHNEVTQARALILEAGSMPPRGLGAKDADPMRWLFPDGSVPVSPDPADAGDAGDASISLLPSLEAPHGWVLLGDGGDARPRPVTFLPDLPTWQLDAASRPKAVSRPNMRPQGYTPGFVADPACREAGKRLCREEEWVFACKGQNQTKHPYGNDFRQGRCNVFRQDHPGRILHGSWSTGLSDPRLNTMSDSTGSLLRSTGGTPACKSEWGEDAIFDMVGNLDEWVDDASGVFVGGFFSRNTRNGCEARVGSHPIAYFDYSTGFRCCADLASAAQGTP
jgi:hypothetical protein